MHYSVFEVVVYLNIWLSIGSPISLVPMSALGKIRRQKNVFTSEPSYQNKSKMSETSIPGNLENLESLGQLGRKASKARRTAITGKLGGQLGKLGKPRKPRIVSTLRNSSYVGDLSFCISRGFLSRIQGEDI